MRYRAVAIASPRSNAVGSVELECSAHGLFIAYLGVGAFSQGYAPGALASGTGVTVPWSQVTEARAEGAQVFVGIDHRVTPLNQLLLMHFATGRAPPPEELAKRRLIVRFAAVSAALAAALIVLASVLRGSPEASAGAAVAVATLAALVLLTIGFLVDRNLVASGDEDSALAGFCMELGYYLPALVRLPRTPAPTRPLPNISELQGLIPRTTLAVVITLTAGALAVLLVARWVTTNESAIEHVTTRILEPPPDATPRAPSPPSPPAAQAPAPAPAPRIASATPPSSDGVPFGDDCRCGRADSTLWALPIPRLSVLLLSRRVRQGRGPDENHRKSYLELDVAVVNNSDKPIDEVALLVLFYERDPPPSEKRSQSDNRSLFFEGPLLPGQAIKWSVEGEGTEFEIKNPIAGDIGPNGEDAAPTNRVAELLLARNRPVRLHGAMLLAFLGDARARDGVLALREALREDEAPYLNRLIQALSEVRVCQLSVAGTGNPRAVSACVYNTGKEARRDIGLKLRGLAEPVSAASPVGEPPSVLVESTLKLGGELPAQTGRSVKTSLDLGGQEPQAFEAAADRYDLVR